MSLSYSLFKNKLRKTIVDSLYNEVITKTSRYYHWLGKENSWADFLSPFIPSSASDIPGPPQNNFRYDLHVRRDILTAKAIQPSDVSYVVPRLDWKFGEIYDIYDDAYTEPIAEAIQWTASLQIDSDDIIKVGSIYYRAVNAGVLGNAPPTHVVGFELNGTVDLAYFTRDEFAFSGATSLEESRFYVITSEFNVYKCIWNNNNSPSTVMPTSTSLDIIQTSDGYKWKFMYPIPTSLRNRFLSNEWMPVTTALTNQFYTNGSIDQVIIDNPGFGYSENTLIIVTGDGYLPDNPYILTNPIKILDPGMGYTEIPSATISAPTVEGEGDEQALAEVELDGDVVGTITLTNAGYGYDAVPYPTITIDNPVEADAVWEAFAEVNEGDIIEADVELIDEFSQPYVTTVFYEVTTAGTLGEDPPIHIENAKENGNAKLTAIARRAVGLVVIVKSEAELSPVIKDGQITGVIITNPGIGYSNANIEVVDDEGQGAVILPNFSIGNIDSIQANVELNAVPGTIEVIKVVDSGEGYGQATVQIRGDGEGATAIAQLASGRLVGVQITNPGTGYTWTDVVISGNGTGATARAIMSPINGHGFDAIDELNANSLMFYSSISRDKNQGIEINNDYRKVGLIKNLKQFGSNQRFTATNGSGCVLITGVFDKTKLDYDMLLVKDGFKNYRIVDFNDTQILVSVFNNFPLFAGDTLVTERGYSFSVLTVQERTIDQFSGDLLFLSVREPFSPTSEQFITLRTVITI